jgi:NitT/TauT family transport system permease protein
VGDRPKRHASVPVLNGIRTTRLRRGLIGALVLFFALEALTRAELVNSRYLPPASTILATTVGLLVDREFLGAALGTVVACVIGLAIATLIAVPLGIVLGSSRRGYLASISAIEFLRPIPSVALIPLVIVLRGRGLEMKVDLIVYACLWPILFNTIYGMHEVDPVARDTARAFGYRPLEVLRRVSLPSAAPFIYTGIRVSSAIALILAISAELIAGGAEGIGTWMYLRSQSDTGREFVYAGIVFAGLIGLAVNWLLVAGERRMFAWHQRVRAA